MLQSAFQPYITVATAREPKLLRALALDHAVLGFTSEYKIDVFAPQEKKTSTTNKQTSKPDELDFSALNTQTGFDLANIGFSQQLVDQCVKLKQLGLMYKLCKEAGLEPGCSLAEDEKILALLRETLSDNITNKSAVIKEFINLWNAIASLPEASAHRNQRPSSIESHHPIFIYHKQYEDTVRSLCEQMMQHLVQSEKFNNFLLKITTHLGVAEAVPATIVRQMLEAEILSKAQEMQKDFLNPPPKDLVTKEELEQVSVAIQKVFGADLSSQEQFVNGLNTIKLISSRIESRRPLYTPLREGRQRDSQLEREQKIRSRSRSPIRVLPNDADKRDRSRDRTPPRSGY